MNKFWLKINLAILTLVSGFIFADSEEGASETNSVVVYNAEHVNTQTHHENNFVNHVDPYEYQYGHYAYHDDSYGCCFEPCEPSSCNSICVEYLYWKPYQTNMSYALAIDALALTPPAPNTTILNMDSSWDSGFRVGVGHTFCGNIDLGLKYTRFHSSNSTTASDPIIIATELIGVNPNITVGGTNFGGVAISDWHLEFDMLDFDICFPLYNNCGFAFSPYVGVKGGWIHQKQTINYTNFVDMALSETLNGIVTERSKFSGVGPKVGIDSRYAFSNGLSVKGNLAASFLYGNANYPVSQFIEEPIGTVFADSTVKFKEQKIIPAIQLLVGIDWSTCICDQYLVTLGAGYEVQYFAHTWRNQNSYIQDIYVTDAGYGDLMFQGLTVDLSVNF